MTEAASLLDMARGHKPKRRGPRCAVDHFLRSHSRADEIKSLIAAARDGEILFSVAAEILDKADIDIPAGTLRRHARGDCSCS